MKLTVIVGTRPQLIKISPLMREIIKKKEIECQFIDTGQHYDYELNKRFYEELNLPKSTFLDVGSSDPGEQTGKALIALEKELKGFKPDFVLVIGDTNSTVAGALAAVKQKIPVGHIEAGLRSFDRDMPEEINRVIVDHISNYLFTPTKNAMQNLINEGIPKGKIKFTYDISVDACLENYKIAKEKSDILTKLNLKPREYVLLTSHRQENVDEPRNLRSLVNIIDGIDKPVVFPMHPRTKKNLEKSGNIKDLGENCIISKPLGYFDFLVLMKNCACIITDSGGVQKEALILKTPCITIRTTTEWTETLDLGANVLVGLDETKVFEELEKRTTKEFYKKMESIKNPYGEGKTSELILDQIKKGC